MLAVLSLNIIIPEDVFADDLSSCTTLTSGTYILVNDITDGNDCIFIDSNNVTINGAGHTLVGNIVGQGYTFTLQNITVQGNVSSDGNGGSDAPDNTTGGGDGTSGGYITIYNSRIEGNISANGGNGGGGAPGDDGPAGVSGDGDSGFSSGFEGPSGSSCGESGGSGGTGDGGGNGGAGDSGGSGTDGSSGGYGGDGGIVLLNGTIVIGSVSVAGGTGGSGGRGGEGGAGGSANGGSGAPGGSGGSGAGGCDGGSQGSDGGPGGNGGNGGDGGYGGNGGTGGSGGNGGSGGGGSDGGSGGTVNNVNSYYTSVNVASGSNGAAGNAGNGGAGGSADGGAGGSGGSPGNGGAGGYGGCDEFGGNCGAPGTDGYSGSSGNQGSSGSGGTQGTSGSPGSVGSTGSSGSDGAINVFWSHAGSSDGTSNMKVVTSYDGTKVFRLTASHLYYSSDGGVNYTSVLTNSDHNSHPWSSVATSYDGTVLYVIASNGGIWKSTNTGSSWTELSGGLPSSASWQHITTSADGQIVYATLSNSSTIWRSTNGGVSWSSGTVGVSDLGGIVTSPDGSIVAVAGYNGSAGKLYLSSNAGATWTLKSNAYIEGVPKSLAYTSYTNYIFISDSLGNVYRYNINADTFGTVYLNSGTPITSIAVDSVGSSMAIQTADSLNLSTDTDFTVGISQDLSSAILVSTASSADGSKVYTLATNGSVYNRKNIYLDHIGPIPVSFSVSGTSATITFNEDVGGAIDYSAITFYDESHTRTGVSGSVSGNQINLTLNGSITDSLSVSRIQFGPTGIIDSNSNGLSVTNFYNYRTSSVVADATAPTVSLTSPVDAALVSGSITMSASASDDTALAGVKFYVDETLSGSEDTSDPYEVSLDTALLSDGSHTIIAVARDTSNNYATSTSVSVTVDNTAPTISSIASSTTSSTATVTWNTTADTSNSKVSYGTTSGVYAVSSSSPSTVTSHSISISGLSDSTRYYFVAVSRDVAGNTSTSSERSFVTSSAGDVTAPTVLGIDSTKSNGTYGPGTIIPITVTFSEEVTSTGDVTLVLDTGRTCVFSITNSSVGSCNYTALGGDNSSDLTVASISGTVRDGSDNLMTSFTPATNLSSNRDIVISSTLTSSGGGGGGSSGGGSILAVQTQNIPAITNPVVTNPVVVDTKNAPVITNQTFTRTLVFATRGNDVKTLQQFLNTHGFPVAPSGVGSKGKETTLFGNATRNALIAYQKAKGIKPAIGIFGPITRKAILADSLKK